MNGAAEGGLAQAGSLSYTRVAVSTTSLRSCLLAAAAVTVLLFVTDSRTVDGRDGGVGESRRQ
jgi:hypothetical protein